MATRCGLHDAGRGEVFADERYFLVRVTGDDIDLAGQEAFEREVMKDHRWWSVGELRATEEVVFPEDLADMVAQLVLA